MTVYKYVNGILVPIKQESPSKPTPQEVAQQYYELHKCCPACGGMDYSTTTMGFLMLNLDTAKDSNIVNCCCGWTGIVHDLLPEKI